MRSPGRLAAAAIAVGAAVTVLAAPAATAGTATAGTRPTTTASVTAATSAVPKLDHVFLIMEENNGFQDVIGNKAAPNLNYLASTFGLETDYYGLSTQSSETNYVGLLGGSTYGVTSDDAYWKNAIKNKPSLITQLDNSNVSWKAYMQSLPYAGYQGICYPARCNGAPDSDPLYVSKHDAIQNFTEDWNTADWNRQVPYTELATDLKTNNVPRFSYIAGDECHDMHGDPPYCLDSGNIGDPQNQHLMSVGDAFLGQTVSDITHAGFWAKGNNAIIVTYDNGDDTKGCCDQNPGGGRVATIVITSHGPRHITDSQPANHYSTLATIEHSFGLGCIANACDTKNVQPYGALFAATGEKAIATTVKPQLTWPTPTPSQPAEPLGETPAAATASSWVPQQAQTLGTGDNSLGAIAGSGPDDIWAVGNYLPDAKNSNTDATLTFAEHWDGTKWAVVRTPDTGPNFNSFYGLAARDGYAWAVGEHLNARFQDRALLEVWNGKSWSIADVKNPGSVRDMLFGASALSPDDVWTVGDQEGRDNVFHTLAEHWDGTKWTVVPTPNPGASGSHLYAVDAVSPDDVWAVGQQLTGRVPDQGLVEHWDGHRWSVVPLPHSGDGNVLFDGVTVSGGKVYVVGESDTPAGGGQPLVEIYDNGTWTAPALPKLPDGANWGNLYAVAAAGGRVWADGTYVDPASDNNEPIVLRGAGGSWTSDVITPPGSGSNLPGGLTAIGSDLWLAGTYNNGGSRLPLIMKRVASS
jgi:hypothetical protein